MLGQQFHKCLLGSSAGQFLGTWGDYSKHMRKLQGLSPWTLYPQVLCNSDLCTLCLSECLRGGDDSRTFEHKGLYRELGR